MDNWTPPDLGGEVAVVTGASQGVGRGIADVLAACGATTYVVSRNPTEAAAAINAAGGTAIAASCDVGDDAQVALLVDRVAEEAGHVQILVNNAVGWASLGDGDETGSQAFLMEPPWRAPVQWWDANFDVGVRSHWAVTNAMAPLMLPGRRGLVVFTSERQPDEAGMQEMVMDLRATAVQRMAHLFALHLRPHKLSSVFLYPGFTRTETIARLFGTRSGYFEGWTEDRFLAETVSPQFAGRAVATLATANRLDWSGTLKTAHEVAVAYGFTDVDGSLKDPI